jgi:hypothetical protein
MWGACGTHDDEEHVHLGSRSMELEHSCEGSVLRLDVERDLGKIKLESIYIRQFGSRILELVCAFRLGLR